MAIEIKTLIKTQELVDKVLQTLPLLGGNDIVIRVGSHRQRLVKKFYFPEQQPGEGDLAYAKKLQNKFWKACLEINEDSIANARIANDEAQIDRTVVKIPEGDIG